MNSRYIYMYIYCEGVFLRAFSLTATLIHYHSQHTRIHTQSHTHTLTYRMSNLKSIHTDSFAHCRFITHYFDVYSCYGSRRVCVRVCVHSVKCILFVIAPSLLPIGVILISTEQIQIGIEQIERTIGTTKLRYKQQLLNCHCGFLARFCFSLYCKRKFEH